MTQHTAASTQNGAHAPDSAKAALVTGGTDGIGRATANKLAARGWTVVLVGSNAQKGEKAAQAMTAETGNEAVTFMQADLSLMKEVRRLAGAFKEKHGRLDALVHSAGVIHSERGVTEEGLEASFAINYLSRFLLTNLLLSRLKASAPARVVNVAYAGGNSADALDFGSLQSEKEFGGMKALNQAPVANDLFGLELAERLEGTGVGVAVVNPGLVATDIRRKADPWFMRLIDYALFFMVQTPEESTETPVWLAADADLAAMNGRFFGPKREEKAVPDELRDPALRERLWRASAELSGLRAGATASPDAAV